MDDAEQHACVQRLGQAMSEISEDCYCAGWLGCTEYLVPELCRRAIESGRTQYWGHGEVTPELARELTVPAERAGCWAVTDYYSVGYDPFQPFPIPHEYVESIEREQSSDYARLRQSHVEPVGAPAEASRSGRGRPMLDEQGAIEAARRLFVTRIEDSSVRNVTALTMDGGQSWVVHFHKRLPPNVVESPGSWVICVCSETGGCNWVELL